MDISIKVSVNSVKLYGYLKNLSENIISQLSVLLNLTQIRKSLMLQ